MIRQSQHSLFRKAATSAICLFIAGTLFSPSLQAMPSFGSPNVTATDPTPYYMHAADWDKDGNLDIAIALHGVNTLQVLWGDGTGNFTLSSQFGAGDTGVCSGDFDGDGCLDIVGARHDLDPPTLNVMVGNGDRTFGPTNVSLSGQRGTIRVVAADFNGDQNLDLACANSGVTNTVSIYLGDGMLGFSGQDVTTVGDPYNLAVADYDTDGDLDLLVVGNVQTEFALLRNDGSGTFAADSPTALANGSTLHVCTGDFNRDGNPDAAITHQNLNSITVLIGDGTGSFSETNIPSIFSSAGCKGIVCSDFDLDGNQDLAVAGDGTNSVAILAGDGSGGFSSPVIFPIGMRPEDLITGDFDNDLRPDLAATNIQFTGEVGVILNTAMPPCVAGNVNAAPGPISDVLFVNGSAGAGAFKTVTVNQGEDITVALNASPAGPAEPSYVLWAWFGQPTGNYPQDVVSSFLGCTGNPTPLQPFLGPQPFRCVRSDDMPGVFCADVREISGPARAPWNITKQGGFNRSSIFTLQALIGDAGSNSSDGFSLTNIVVIIIP